MARHASAYTEVGTVISRRDKPDDVSERRQRHLRCLTLMRWKGGDGLGAVAATFPPSMLLQTPPSDVSMSDLRYDICASPQVRLIPPQEHITERTCKCAQPVSVDMLVDSLAIPRVVCTGVVLSRAIRGDREIYVGQLNAVIRFNFSICSAHS